MIAVLSIVTILLVVAVLITLVHNDYWVFKVLEYPRLQKMVLVVIALGGWLFYWPQLNLFQQVLFYLLCASAVYLAYKIWPYTAIAPKEMKTVAAADDSTSLKIFAANVFQDNRDYQRMLQQISSTNPDIIFLLETDKGWADGVQELVKKYPNTLQKPIDNTYGLLFFSRLPIEGGKVNFLVKDDIPSIEATLILANGQKVKMWGLHPEPPVPGENLYATAKDKELMKVALQVADCPLPAIVFGDLNDVAWSHTTELFRKTSRLLDPRRGRGFYSTFSAHHWFVRFPLDYIFCSKEFGLVKMKRLPKNGSDHFATFTHLVFNENLKTKQQPPKPYKDELEEAKETAAQPLKEGS